MKSNENFEHLSGRISARDLGLGWISDLTLLKSEKAVSSRPHSHPHMEVIFCLSGEFCYEIQGHSSVVLSSGMGLVIPARTVHAISGGTEGPGMRVGLHLNGRITKKPDFAVFTSADFHSFWSVLRRHANTPFSCQGTVLIALKTLVSFLQKRPEDLSSIDCGLIRILCNSILCNLSILIEKPNRSNVAPRMMDNAIRFIEEHHAESVRMDDLVQFMGYSRAHLFTLFKRHTGLTPNDYLIRFRIKKAKEMLSRTRLPVAKIATAVGFRDPAYFAAVFKRHIGRMPSELAKS